MIADITNSRGDAKRMVEKNIRTLLRKEVNIIFAKMKAYFSGPAKIHKILTFFVLLFIILDINLFVVAIVNSNHLRSRLFNINIDLLLLITMTYLTQLIRQDNLKITFLDIGLCFMLFIGLIQNHNMFFAEVPTFLIEYAAHIGVVGFGLIFLIYKILKSREKSGI